MLNLRIERKFKFNTFWCLWCICLCTIYIDFYDNSFHKRLDQISDSDFYRMHYIEVFTEDHTDRIEFTYRT